MTRGRSESAPEAWPSLPYADWKNTYETLHLWTQIVGKIRVAQTPWVNHQWHVALYPTARGLATSSIPDQGRTFEIEFDFINHALDIRSSDGRSVAVPLTEGSVAEFHAAVLGALNRLDIDVQIHSTPNEIPGAVPFREDKAHRAFVPEQAQRFWQALLQVDRVFKRFRSGFLGKASPVHFFWGSFDLAVTRFSGRPAPAHPGGVPGLPDAITREAYSHELSSAGFWPGGGAVDYPAFYSYAYPEPPNFRFTTVAPREAFFHEQLGEFLLPYEAVRTAANPDAVLLAFLRSTYEAAADAGGWDRAALECPLGEPGVPRVI
ncbi:MAG: DUF5996 family protein [Gammaproteobacteria bacterium]